MNSGKSDSKGPIEEDSFGELVIDHGNKKSSSPPKTSEAQEPKPDKNSVSKKSDKPPLEGVISLRAPATSPAPDSSPPNIKSGAQGPLEEVPELVNSAPAEAINVQPASGQRPSPAETATMVGALASQENDPHYVSSGAGQSQYIGPEHKFNLADGLQEPVVPGGVSERLPNPAGYFKSRYRQRAVTAPVASTPQLQPAAIATGMPPAPAPTRRPGRQKFFSFSPKVALIASIAGITFLGLGVWAFISLRPSSGYEAAMGRTGKALNQFHEQFLSDETLSKLQNSEINGSLDAAYSGEIVNGTITGSYQSKKAVIAVEGTVVQPPATEGAPFDISARVSPSQDNSAAALFVRFGGPPLKTTDLLIPGFSKFTGSWVQIPPDDTQSIINKTATAAMRNAPVGIYDRNTVVADTTEIDINRWREVSGLFGDLAAEHVFTGSGGIFKFKEDLGEEDLDGTLVRHYSVNLDKNEFLEFCLDAKDSMLKKQSIAYLIVGTVDSLNETASCDEAAGKIDESRTHDVWVNPEFKVVQKLRTYYSDDLASFVDIGQNYQSPDAIELYYLDNNSVSLQQRGVTLWVNKADSRFGMKYTSRSLDDKNTQLNFGFELSPNSEGPDDFAIPETSIMLSDAVSQLGLNIETLLSPKIPQ